MAHKIEDEFLSNFHEVAQIGATAAGGVDRQAATSKDQETRAWFTNFAHRHGWETGIDEIGNLFAHVRLSSRAIDLAEPPKVILTGSHLDSQPRGGRFDGAYGVISALHAAAAIEQKVVDGEFTPKYDLVVVDWFNEEGSRFPPSIMGSSVYAGLMDLDTMLAVTDHDGITVQDALEAINNRSKSVAEKNPAIPTLESLAGYFEIHIEQGRILEREGLSLGAVDSSWYTQKLDIEILGEQSHTGATAMADRKDALVGAAFVVLLFQQVCDLFPPESLVSSVGQVTVEPNSPIVVNSRIHLVADLRANDPAIVKEARNWLLSEFEKVEERTALRIVAKDFDIRPNRFFPIEGVELQEKVAADMGLGMRRMQTMAGHDSVAMNNVTPSVMMFIPSEDGVSHCEREFTNDHDMINGMHAQIRVLEEMLTGAMDGTRFPGKRD